MLILSASHYCVCALFYSANHAPYTYTDVIIAGTDTLSFVRRNYFFYHARKQKNISDIMDMRACRLLVQLYNMCYGYFDIGDLVAARVSES